MRFLVSCIPGEGHFRPLLPLARALRERGHEVAFAVAGEWSQRVAEEGFAPLAAGVGHSVARGFVPERAELLAAPPSERRALLFSAHLRPRARAGEAPRAAGADGGVGAGGGRPRQRGPGGAARCSRGRVAQREPRVRRDGPAPGLAPRRRAERAAVARAGARGRRARGCLPRPLRRHRASGARACRAARPVGAAAPGRAAARRRAARRGGGAAGLRHDGHDLERRSSSGCSSTRSTVIRPSSRSDAARRCRDGFRTGFASSASSHRRRCCRTHARSSRTEARGTILGALAHGLPLVLLPQGADQFDNAVLCERAGAAVVLLPGEADAASVRAAIDRVLEEPSFASTARRLAAEIAAMPTAREVAERVETYVTAG